MSDSNASASEDHGDTSSYGSPLARWLVTGAGAVVVLATLAYVAIQLATLDGQAELHVALGEPTVVGPGATRIPVTVRNAGGRVAEAAVVEVCAGPDACAEIAFDYIPFESSVSGAVTLETPLRSPVRSRIVAYRDP